MGDLNIFAHVNQRHLLLDICGGEGGGFKSHPQGYFVAQALHFSPACPVETQASIPTEFAHRKLLILPDEFHGSPRACISQWDMQATDVHFRPTLPATPCLWDEGQQKPTSLHGGDHCQQWQFLGTHHPGSPGPSLTHPP